MWSRRPFSSDSVVPEVSFSSVLYSGNRHSLELKQHASPISSHSVHIIAPAPKMKPAAKRKMNWYSVLRRISSREEGTLRLAYPSSATLFGARQGAKLGPS